MEKYLKILGFVIWVILTIIIVDALFSMMTLPNTIANVLGIIGLVLYSFISYASRCFTNWQKYEKTTTPSNDSTTT